MSEELEAARLKAEATYNAAADSFDAEPLAFWDRAGRGAVARLELRPGERVLDVCCGSGASALPAAAAVGPTGEVIAVDLADRLLERGRARARSAGLAWLDFRRGDMTALGFADACFDAVVCVFGIFFVPDMEAQVRELWRMVRPGGQLSITTWGPRAFAPADQIWWDAVHRVRPDLRAVFNPWDRITTPAAVAGLFRDSGIDHVDVVMDEGAQPLRAAADFWTIVRGTGFRWTLDQMRPEEARTVEQDVIARLAAGDVRQLEINIIHALARKSPAASEAPG